MPDSMSHSAGDESGPRIAPVGRLLLRTDTARCVAISSTTGSRTPRRQNRTGQDENYRVPWTKLLRPFVAPRFISFVNIFGSAPKPRSRAQATAAPQRLTPSFL